MLNSFLRGCVVCLAAFGLVLVPVTNAQDDDHRYDNDDRRDVCAPSRGLWWGCEVEYEKPVTEEEFIALEEELVYPAAASTEEPVPVDDDVVVAEGDLELSPFGLIALPASASQLLWVERQTSLLHRLERSADSDNSGFVLIDSLPLETGIEPPLGIYSIGDDATGSPAYPIGFPNTLDRLWSNTGADYWLHCDADTTEDVAEQCLTRGSDNAAFITDYVQNGHRLVIISSALEREDGPNEAAKVMATASDWLEAWKSLDTDLYLGFYHKDFFDFERDYSAFSSYKRAVNNAKTSVDVEISDLTAMYYPGDDGLILMRFFQVYTSNNYNWSGWKELLWRRQDDGAWKILYEGHAAL